MSKLTMKFKIFLEIEVAKSKQIYGKFDKTLNPGQLIKDLETLLNHKKNRNLLHYWNYVNTTDRWVMKKAQVCQYLLNKFFKDSTKTTFKRPIIDSDFNEELKHLGACDADFLIKKD